MKRDSSYMFCSPKNFPEVILLSIDDSGDLESWVITVSDRFVDSIREHFSNIGLEEPEVYKDQSSLGPKLRSKYHIRYKKAHAKRYMIKEIGNFLESQKLDWKEAEKLHKKKASDYEFTVPELSMQFD